MAELPVGSSLCRCSVCQRTFRNLGAFDAHRPDRNGCGDPATVGLVEHAGVWATPEGHAQREALAARMATMRRAPSPPAQNDERGETLPEVPHG